MSLKTRKLTQSIRLIMYGASFTTMGAFAQQTGSDLPDAVNSDDESVVEVIEVTTSRRVQTIQDVPASVVAVKPEELIQQGMTSLTDVIGQAPGFSFHSVTGQQGRGSVSARGVTQQNDTAVTAIYLDDVPLSSNSGFAAGGRLYYDGLLGDIARIELVKGPQGTLFGATAIAGAIRYISKEPDLYEGRGSVSADISQTKDGDVNQLYRGFYSFPLIEDTLGLTVAGYTRDNGGYVDQVDPATGAVIRENANESDDHGFSADLYYHPTDELDIRIKGLRQESSFGLSSAVRIANRDKEEAYGELKSDNAFGSDELIQTVLSASVSYEFEDMVLDVSSSTTKYESANEEDVVTSYGPILEAVGGLEPGSITSVPFVLSLESDKIVHEARLTSTDKSNIEWLAGLFYTKEKTKQNQEIIGQPAGFLGGYAAFPSEYTEYAGFGNVTYYLTPEFDLTAGLRISRNEQTLVFLQDGVLLGGASEETLAPAEDTVETYLLTARYRPNDDTSYYARIASGYRPASSNLTVFDPFTGEQLSQSVVDQDDLWSYELGMKGDALDDTLSYEAALYYIDWQNFQTSVSFFGLQTDGNAKDGITVKGFEGSLDYRMTPNLSVTAGVSYTESTLNGDEPELFGLKGATVPNVPKWTLMSSINYYYQLAEDVDGWLTANVRYKDSTNSAFEDGNPESSWVNMESDDYTLVNLTAGAEWEDIVVTLYANNVFDEKAYTLFNAVVIPGTDVVDITGIPLEPRRVGISLTYSF